MLVRLTYVSKPPPELDQAGLDAIIADIRAGCLRNNARRHLTGSLAYSLSGFAQALEGEQADVLALVDMLRRDPRHRDLTIVQERTITSRAFPDWAMAFAEAPQDADLAAMSGPQLLRFLIETAQHCDGVRSIPGWGPAPEARARGDLGL